MRMSDSIGLAQAACPSITVGTALGRALTRLTTPRPGPAPALPRGQPSLKQFAALLPMSPGSSEVAICLSPARATLTQGPSHLSVSSPVANAETVRPHLLHPHKEARMENPSASLKFWLCYQLGGALRLALSLGASVYPSGLKDPPRSHFPGCLHLLWVTPPLPTFQIPQTVISSTAMG